MHKVIVERPRSGRSWAQPVKTGGSVSVRHVAEQGEDYDSGPRRAPRFEKKKSFNEHLGPLRNYLVNQVGRPWDKVYSEICQGIDRRSVIGAHVLQHVPDFVDLPNEHDCWPRRTDLYVHPRTGILLRRKPAPQREEMAKERNFVALQAGHAYAKKDGLWFELKFHERDPYEIVEVRSGKRVPAFQTVGWTMIAVDSKRQCNRKEIARIEAGEFGPGCHVDSERFFRRVRWERTNLSGDVRNISK
ncbi:MAG: hypothetical protein U0Q16_26850 [Bryobacteraceae bacterium]